MCVVLKNTTGRAATAAAAAAKKSRQHEPSSKRISLLGTWLNINIGILCANMFSSLASLALTPRRMNGNYANKGLSKLFEGSFNVRLVASSN
jgi:hypothetical protein